MSTLQTIKPAVAPCRLSALDTLSVATLHLFGFDGLDTVAVIARGEESQGRAEESGDQVYPHRRQNVLPGVHPGLGRTRLQIIHKWSTNGGKEGRGMRVIICGTSDSSPWYDTSCHRRCRKYDRRNEDRLDLGDSRELVPFRCIRFLSTSDGQLAT